MHTFALGVTLFLLFALAPAAHGQSRQRLSIELGAAYTAKNSDYVGRLNALDLVGPDVQLRVTPGRLSFGVGAYRHQWQTRVTYNKVTATDVYFEPRLVAAAYGRGAAYLSARVGSAFFDCQGCDESEAGPESAISWGGGAGLLARLGSRVTLDVGAQSVKMPQEYAGRWVVARVGLIVGLR